MIQGSPSSLINLLEKVNLWTRRPPLEVAAVRLQGRDPKEDRQSFEWSRVRDCLHQEVCGCNNTYSASYECIAVDQIE
jgi:hypothetical protein